jgi:hypothetical protein
VAPLQGAGERSLRSGGLRCAPTAGYYLTAFQAEDALATLSQSRGGGHGSSGLRMNRDSRAVAGGTDKIAAKLEPGTVNIRSGSLS